MEHLVSKKHKPMSLIKVDFPGMDIHVTGATLGDGVENMVINVEITGRSSFVGSKRLSVDANGCYTDCGNDTDNNLSAYPYLFDTLDRHHFFPPCHITHRHLRKDPINFSCFPGFADDPKDEYCSQLARFV